MKTMKRIIFLACVCFLILGCASTPGGKYETLLVGVVIHEGKNFGTTLGLTIDGINKDNIEITIYEINRKKSYTLKTKGEGIFFSEKLPEGTYQLRKLFLRNTLNNASVTVAWETQNDIRFEVVNGKINNLGIINWNCEKNVRNSITYNRDHDEVAELFKTRKEYQNWNEKEWSNTGIRRITE